MQRGLKISSFFHRLAIIANTTRIQANCAYQKYPAGLLLYGIVAGIAPAVLAKEICFWQNAAYSLLILLPVLLLLPRRCHITLLALLFGTLLTPIYLWMLPDKYLNLLGNGDRGAEITVKIADTSCAGKTLPWLKNPKLIKAELFSVRLNGSHTASQTSGLIAVVMPRGSALVNYGDMLTLKGVFRQPAGSLLESQFNIYPENSNKKTLITPFCFERYGEFNFKNYLLARGISRIFYSAETIHTGTDVQTSWYGTVLYCRDKIMHAVAAGIKQDELSAMLATLLFGYRQGLEPETRAAFIWSGTIHIFSVGGMHVVILAMLLFWLLRPLGFRARHILIPLLIAIYVVASGAEPPAVRSLLMITLWAWCRAWLRYTPTLNIVFIAAIIVLAVNPLYLLDIGVQYSFITVIFLIASGTFMREWELTATEAMRWIPPGYRSNQQFFWRKKVVALFMAAAGCVLAWLVSSGISLYYQGIYFPLSIIANIIIIPFVSWLFIISGLKLMLIPFAALNNWLGNLLELMLSFIIKICTFFYDYFENIPMIQPPVWALLIFYAALAAMVIFRNKRVFWTMLTLMTVLLLSWRILPFLSRGELIMLNGGGSQEICLILCPPRGMDAIVVNAPSWEAGQRTINLLRRRGITGIDQLILAGTRKDYCAGIKVLLAAFKVNQIIIEKPPAGNMFIVAALKELNPSQTRVIFNDFFPVNADARINFITKNNDWQFEYQDSNFHITGKVIETNPGRRTVTVNTDKYPVAEAVIYNSSVLEERTFSFK